MSNFTVFSVYLTDGACRYLILKPLLSSLRAAIDCSIIRPNTATVTMSIFDHMLDRTYHVHLIFNGWRSLIAHFETPAV